MSYDLTMWLLEQIAEDERVASTLSADGYPVLVLVECDAKRRIIEHCWDSITGWQVDETNSTDAACAIVDLEHVLKLLALPYADRPGYREEWRP